MRRFVAILLTVFLLSGCSGNQKSIEPGLKLREQLFNSNGCSFEAKITADYGDEIYDFSMQCSFDKVGNMTFIVNEPESIYGISGTISLTGGSITFEEKALAFPLMADEQITPISAPWLLIKTLRGGYLRACEERADEIHLIFDDSYEEDALQADVYLTNKHIPVRGEFLFRGRRIITIDVINFTYL